MFESHSMAFAERFNLPVSDVQSFFIELNSEDTVLLSGNESKEKHSSGAWGTGSSVGSRLSTEINESLSLFNPEGTVLCRYEDHGLLARGGMGEIRRVRDQWFGRMLAMKIIRPAMLESPSLVERFIEEAEVTAQLQHPGIVPVHDRGRLPDGRLWFTMKEIKGRNLARILHEQESEHQQTGQEGGTKRRLRRLMSIYLRLCQTMAYAHSRGVIHRDLKPENIMVGEHGEVMVMDWGLVKVMSKADSRRTVGKQKTIETSRSTNPSASTRVGVIAGTPLYMSPEQASGRVDLIDARSDVYALGAVLYHILTGRKPLKANHSDDLPGQGMREPLVTALSTQPDVPLELAEICDQAMAWRPMDRYASVATLAAEIADWLDGVKRQAKARAVVVDALKKIPEAERLRQEAEATRAAGLALLEGVEGWQPEEDKLPGWDKLDKATELEHLAERAELEEVQLLHAALSHAPELPDAHAELARRYHDEHAEGESARKNVVRSEYLLRSHVSALPKTHPARASHDRYLKGDGVLTLVSDPPGAEVELYRYETHHRRLVPRLVRCLGTTPIVEVPLEMGSYLCIIKHPDCHDVRYPVFIERGGHWDGVSPGETEPTPIRLPRSGELAKDECYVPTGWFYSGGDDNAYQSLPRRHLWCPPVVMKRYPVTNREYLRFLNALLSEEREEEALRFVPRERAGQAVKQGAMIYGRDKQGCFELVADTEGDLWEADWPVMMVDWHSARAYALWSRHRTGQPWRLPCEYEWAKAARGVDGRFFPWGDHVDPSWCCYRDSHRGRHLPVVVGSYPIDESPYGVRDMAGNMKDWCGDVWSKHGTNTKRMRVLTPTHSERTNKDDQSGSLRVIRGGSWHDSARRACAAFRGGHLPVGQNSNLGFRLARGPVPAHGVRNPVGGAEALACHERAVEAGDPPEQASGVDSRRHWR